MNPRGCLWGLGLSLVLFWLPLALIVWRLL